jgi:hypothetical protein
LFHQPESVWIKNIESQIMVHVMNSVPSIKELKPICQTAKSAEHDSLYGRKVVRKASIRFTWVFLHSRISANVVTCLWGASFLLAAFVFSLGIYPLIIIAPLLVHLGYILDDTDGEIARFRKTSSKKGEYLDRIFHDITYPSLFIGISVGVYLNTHDWVILLLGMICAMFRAQLWLIDLEKIPIPTEKKPITTEEILTDSSKTTEEKKPSLLNSIRKKGIDPIGIDSMIYILLIGSILNLMFYVFILYSILIPLRWGFAAFVNLREYKGI